ncbi:MAG: hypothetical protein R3B09_20635 [Nannocystaceae bacterium]
MRRPVRRLARDLGLRRAALAIALATAPSAIARASEGPAEPATARPRQVRVAVVDGLGPSADDLERALRGHVTDLDASVGFARRSAGDDLGVMVAWARGEQSRGADAVLWIEPGGEGPAILYLLHGSPARLFLRPVTLGADPLETEEILGVIVRGTLASLQGDEAPPGMQEIEAPPVEAAAEAPEEAPPTDAAPGPEPPPSRPRARGFVGLGYAGSSLSAELPWASGVGLVGGREGARGLLLTASIAWTTHGAFTPHIGATELDGAIGLHRLAAELALGVRLRPGPRRRGFVDVVAGVRGEAWIWRPRGGSSAEAGGGGRLSLGPGVGGGLDLGRRVAIAAWARLDAWLLNLDLVARTPAGTTPLVHPPPVGASVLAAVIIRLGRAAGE